MAAVASHSELRMLFACARVSLDLEQIRKLASDKIDWLKLAGAAEFHGVAPLLRKNLQAANVSVPADAADELERHNAATSRQNLFLTSELLRVHAALKDRGIEAIPLKGPAVASEFYGDLGMRPFSDIDLLVRSEQVREAENAAKELGYSPEFPIPPEHYDGWLAQQCELTFRRAGTVRLELHWDIAHPHFALDTGVEGFWSRLTTVRIGDTTLSHLCLRDLLFTLIVHGTRHAWSRMMWLVDVAELLRRNPAIDWEVFWQEAQLRGAARMMATGLVLAREVFDVSVSRAAAERAHKDSDALALAARVIAHWDQGFDRPDMAEAEPTPLWRHRWIINARENRTQRWVYARRVMMMTGEEEFAAVSLPRILSPYYKVIRLWNILRKGRPRG